VSNEAIRRLARRVPGIALAIVPGAQHEILSERDEFRGQFLAAFDSFVTDVVPEAQVTASPPMLPSQQEVA
jgi:lysophospholipase